MEFERGCIVKCVYGFMKEKRDHPHNNYPDYGDYLTVRGSGMSPNRDVLLTFEELRTTTTKLAIPLAAFRFQVVQTAEEGREVVKKIFTK